MEPSVSVSIEAEHAPIMAELPIGYDSVAFPGRREHHSNNEPIA
jgi:hypothetical protein